MNTPVTNASIFAQNRYTCKAYDSTKKIDDTTFGELMNCLRLAPSSINIQPWKFLIAHHHDTKQRITNAMTGGNAHNIAKVMDASHIIIFCTRQTIDDAHLSKVLQSEKDAGRFASEEAFIMRQKTCQYYINEYRQEPVKLQQWADEQIFIALGHLLLCAQMMGIAATPIGGFDKAVLDTEFTLAAQALRSTVIVALGYASEQDFNQHLPKARLDFDDVFTYLT